MIPIWVVAIPLFAYIILNGLAAQNTRINQFEKAIISVLVPIGFVVTLVALIWYVEDQKAKRESGNNTEP